MDSPLIESLNTLIFQILATLMTPSSIEGLMGLWEEHLVSLKGLELGDDSPRGCSLSHLTAHQMRDVAPNRWWER